MSTLVGIAEIAQLAGLSKQAVINWRERYDDFPEPVAELKAGPVWQADAIKKWAARHDVELKPNGLDEDQSTNKCVVVALVNMKGGVGKSTLSANLGWYCAWRRTMRVLFVDLDPQFNLSQYLLGRAGYAAHVDKNKPTIVDIFEHATPYAIKKKQGTPDLKESILHVKNWSDGSLIDLIPSRLELAWTLKNPSQKERMLKNFIETVRDDYDVIIIDCAPTESMLTTAAYLVADYLVVPVKPEFLATVGLPLLVRSLEDFTKSNPDAEHPKLAGIIFNACEDNNEHAKSRKFVEDVAKNEKWYVFKSRISESNSYATGSRDGKPIFLTDYARHWKKNEFETAAKEFLQRIGL